MRGVVNGLEKSLLKDIDRRLPGALLEKFATLVRESGSDDEREAAAFIADRLEALGVPNRIHTPLLYLSLPREAGLRVVSPTEEEFRVKTPSFSVSTQDEWVEGELVFVSTGFATGIGDIFGSGIQEDIEELEGKVVLTEGFPMPGKVAQFEALGVKAAVFISPGERIHEGICTSIWGAPDRDNVGDEPKIPVLAINKSDGQELSRLCGKER